MSRLSNPVGYSVRHRAHLAPASAPLVVKVVVRISASETHVAIFTRVAPRTTGVASLRQPLIWQGYFKVRLRSSSSCHVPARYVHHRLAVLLGRDRSTPRVCVQPPLRQRAIFQYSVAFTQLV